MRQRSSIEWQDIVAANFVVGTDLIECDYLDHQDAINNLPDAGGGIYTLPGNYSRTLTMSLADKSYTLTFAGGAVVSIGSTPIPVFTVTDVITSKRTLVVTGGHFGGENAAGQEFLRYEDSSAKFEVYFKNLTARDLECLVNFTAYEVTYNEVAWVTFEDCLLPPPFIATNEIFKSPNQAGTYTGALAVKLYNCFMTDSLDYTLGWASMDFDGDVFMYNCLETRMLDTAVWEVDGLDVYGSEFE